jgi:hypothetical protein
MHLARACRVLTNDEIETLCGLCESVPRRLRQLVANRQIKTHMAEFEVPRFVRCWRTLGLFCEGAFESIHALMNRMKMRFACIRDRLRLGEWLKTLDRHNVANGVASGFPTRLKRYPRRPREARQAHVHSSRS